MVARSLTAIGMPERAVSTSILGLTDSVRRSGDPMVLSIVSLAVTGLKAAAAGGPLRGCGP
jgi:hypothetical protein